MRTSTSTTARHARFLARARGFAARLADEEVALALRAAGASSQDVELCLGGRSARSRRSRRASACKMRS